MTALPAAPRGQRTLLGVWLLLLLAGAAVLPWNLEAVAGFDALAAAGGRLAGFLASLRAPDLSPAMLQRGAELAAETFAVALVGVGIGLLLAWPLALGASSAVLLGDQRPGRRSWRRRLQLQACRFALDVLRGVPDFVWAIVIATFTHPSAIAGTLAIAVSVAGIFGKVISEQWDNVDPAAYLPLRSTGASRLQVFLYGIQPLAARSVLSFVLMRTECAVRNASVIGVVGGGGLGAALWDEYTNLDRDLALARMATILLFMLALTATVDVAANLLRYQLRVDPNHPRAPRSLDAAASSRRRWLGVGIVLALLVVSAASLRQPLLQVFDNPPDLGFVGRYALGLLLPDLSPAALGSAAREALVPLGIAVVATSASVLLAALLSYPAAIAFQVDAERFTGERVGRGRRLRRWLLLLLARGSALLLRGIPEVAWVMILAIFFRQGITPCVAAVVLHSTGVLARVFTETVDNIPYRRLEQVQGGSRLQTFAYGALPHAWPDWRTYAFFQFEVNVRIGVVLGIVGAGGLGDKFQTNLLWYEYGRASTYLWAMIALTVLIDRVSRWLQLRRLRC